MIPRPLVSIGIPAYNGESYIGQTLASLLAQDFNNIELIVSDDASTDRTAEICLSLARKDSRIRYCRNDENLGLIQNWNRVARLSRGEYFMWAGQHDWWDPHLVSALVSEFSRNQGAVVCFSSGEYQDEDGQLVGAVPPIDTRGLNRWGRINKVFEVLWADSVLYGLMRADVLKKTDLLQMAWACDLILVADLSLHGEFIHVPGVKTVFQFFKKRKMSPRENMIRLLGAKRAAGIKGRIVCSIPRLYPIWVSLCFVKNTPHLSLIEKLSLASTILRLGGRWFRLIGINTMTRLVLAPLPPFARHWLRDFKKRFTEIERQDLQT